jgi:hypothetical protein
MTVSPSSIVGVVPTLSRTRLPLIRRPCEAMILSCQQEDAGEPEAAFHTLEACNLAHDRNPQTSFPPDN